VVGANWTELRVKAKERTEVPGGGVKGTAARVRLTVALPPLPQLEVHGLGAPLQAVRDKATSKRTNKAENDLLRFIWHPTAES
jgi:hypothetical protein